MVFIQVDPSLIDNMVGFLRKNNILITPGKTIRLVTHLDVSLEDVQQTAYMFERFFSLDR